MVSLQAQTSDTFYSNGTSPTTNIGDLNSKIVSHSFENVYKSVYTSDGVE